MVLRAYSSAATAKQVEDIVIVGGGLVGATLAAAVGECGAIPSFFPPFSLFPPFPLPTESARAYTCAFIFLSIHRPPLDCRS